MARTILFSRVYPSYHPKKGQFTFFAEKIWKALDLDMARGFEDLPKKLLPLFDEDFYNEHAIPKYHTIRKGHRFNVGDKFSPRVWSGKPYRSKQIIIAPDIEIKRTWDFEMDLNGVFAIDGMYLDPDMYPILAENDGLNEEDMFHWFMKNYSKPNEFNGQIICWNESINY